MVTAKEGSGDVLVYLDMVMLLNCLVDYLLILGTNRLTGYPPEGARAAGSSLLGSIYAAACLFPDFRFLGNVLWRAVFLLLMAVLAFGWNLGAVRRGAVFILLSMALGGIAGGMQVRHFLRFVYVPFCCGYCAVWALPEIWGIRNIFQWNYAGRGAHFVFWPCAPNGM